MSADFQICISVTLKPKNNFKKVNLNNSNPLVYLHIQSYSLTNSALKFSNLTILKWKNMCFAEFSTKVH